MKREGKIWMLLLLIIVQAGTCDSCYPGDYRNYYDRCVQCPKNCATCRWSTKSSCDTCKVGYYGSGCLSQCSTACKDGQCRKSDGWCRCIEGYNRYSYDWNGLKYSCSRCLDNCLTCTSSKCTKCKVGYYGSVCDQQCYNCRNNTCSINGWCSDGCKDGHYRNNFDCEMCPDNCAMCSSFNYCTLCKDGYFGRKCDKMCLNCRDNSCSLENGLCYNGCKDGYYGETTKCKQCPRNCSICRSETECDECVPGYYGSTCQQRCLQNCYMCKTDTYCLHCITGHYGQSCGTKCSSLCSNGCNKDNGECDDCIGGYYKKDGQCRECLKGCVSCKYTDTCILCQDGFFLEQTTNGCDICGLNCSTCTDTDSCTECNQGYTNVNGSCLSCKNCNDYTTCISKKVCYQCIDGFWGSYCGNKCNDTCIRCDNLTGQCSGCIENTFGPHCERKCSRNCNQLSDSNSSCLQHNGTCTDGCIPGFTGHDCIDESTTATTQQVTVIAGSTVGVVAFIVVVVIFVILMKRKRIGQRDSNAKVQESAGSRGHQAENEVLNPVYSDTNNDNDPITVSGHRNIHSAVAGGSADNVYAVVEKKSPQKPARLNKIHGHVVKNFVTENVYDLTSGVHGLRMHADSKMSQAEGDTYSNISHASRARQLRHDDEDAYDHVIRHDLQKGFDHDETYDIASGHNSHVRNTSHYSNDEYSTLRHANMEQPDFAKREQFNV